MSILLVFMTIVLHNCEELDKGNQKERSSFLNVKRGLFSE